MGSTGTEPPGRVPGPAPSNPSPPLAEEPPPFGGSWRVLYSVVAGTLAGMIVLFYVFTVAFR